MGITVSLHAANGKNGGKIKFHNNGNQYRHTFRKSLNSDKYKDYFKNEDIDWNRTKDNVDNIKKRYLDDNQTSIVDAVKNKFDNEYKGSRKPRKDAVLVRELIIQFKDDDKDFEEMTPEEQKKFIKNSFKGFRATNKYLDKEFDNNIVGASVHLDESNPHMHVYIVPITPDGRLSQGEYFSKRDLTRRHKELRRVVDNATDDEFDVNYDNKSSFVDKSYNIHDYKTNATAIENARSKLRDVIESDVKDEFYEQFRSDPKIKQEAKKSAEDSYLHEHYQKIDEQHGLDFETALRLHKELMEENKKMESVIKRNQIKECDLNKREENIKRNLKRINAEIKERDTAFNKRETKLKERETAVKNRENNYIKTAKEVQNKLNMREKSLDEREIKMNEDIEDIKGDIAYVTFNQVSAMDAIKNGKPQVAYDLLSKSMKDHDNNPRYTNMPTTSELIAFAGEAGFNYKQDPHSPVGISIDAEEIIMQLDGPEYELDGP